MPQAPQRGRSRYRAKQTFHQTLQAPDPPEFLLHNDSGPSRWPSPAALLVSPVEVLNQHSGAPALLEPFLFVITSEFTLDEDGRLCHLFVKCILRGRQKEQDSNNKSWKSSKLRRLRALPSFLP